MRFERKVYKNENIDEAVNQYLNTKKSSYELEKEFGIFRGTLFSRLRKMRKDQSVLNNKSISNISKEKKSNNVKNVNEQNSKKSSIKKVKINNKPNIILLKGGNEEENINNKNTINIIDNSELKSITP